METKSSRRDDWSNQDDVCSACGMTRRELYDRGHMGCAQCYDAFQSEVHQALEEIHGAVQHIGKR